MKHTEKTKEKMRENVKSGKNNTVFKKGHTINVGRKISEETKRKMSLVKTGVYPTEETRKRMSIAQRGRITSPETKEKISNALKGRQGYWLGKKKPQTEETKAKISKTLMGHSVSEKVRKAEKSPFKKGFTPWNKGVAWSEEIKRRISETNKRKNIEPKIKFVGFGKNHPRWKGGTYGTERHRLMGLVEYKLWRKSVYIRDCFTCRKCNNKKKYLNAHHIENFSEVKALRTSIENGITFCKKCHKRFHIIYGVKNNTREQIDEFLNNK